MPIEQSSRTVHERGPAGLWRVEIPGMPPMRARDARQAYCWTLWQEERQLVCLPIVVAVDAPEGDSHLSATPDDAMAQQIADAALTVPRVVGAEVWRLSDAMVAGLLYRPGTVPPEDVADEVTAFRAAIVGTGLGCAVLPLDGERYHRGVERALSGRTTWK